MFQNRIVRRPEVRHITGLSDSALDREIRAGRFARPIPLVQGGRAVGWSLAEVVAWVNAKVEAADRGAA